MRTRLGFGTYRIVTEAHRASLHHALATGVTRLIDTSPSYNNSEQLVGGVLSEVRCSSDLHFLHFSVRMHGPLISQALIHPRVLIVCS